MSTEPVPAEFDSQACFMPSSPPATYRSVPITRARARASAKAVELNAQNNLANLLPNIEAPEPRDKKNTHTHLPRSPRRDQPKIPSRSIKGFDGSVEEHSSDGAESSEGSAGSPSQNECSLLEPSTDQDDLYHLPESEKSSDESEASVTAGTVGRPKCKGRKKLITVTYSTKQRRNNQPKNGGVPIEAKKSDSPVDKSGGPLQENRAQNQAANSPDGKFTQQSKTARDSCRNAKVSTQKTSGTIQDSPASTQDLLSPITTKSKGTINRRPKRPFNAGSPNEHKASPQEVPPFSGNVNIDKQPIAGQETTDSSTSPNVTESPESKSTRTSCQGTRRSTRDVPLPGVKQENGRHGKTPVVGKGKCRDIDHSQLNGNLNTLRVPHILPASDQPAKPTYVDYGLVHPRNRALYDLDSGSTKRPCRFEASKRPTKKSQAALDRTAPSSNINSSIRGHLPKMNLTPLPYTHMREELNEATPTEISVAELSLASFHDQEPERNEKFSSDHTPGYGFSKPRQVNRSTEFSSAEDIPEKGGSQRRQRAGNPEYLPSMKVCKAASDREESLHPNSMTWANMLAERSHKKDLIPVPLEIPGEVDSANQTLPLERDSHKPRISKRESILQNRREAVFESVQEVITAMLLRMQSKESTVNEIMENYRRNGQQLADALLNRQAIEISDVIHAFDKKCCRLSEMFRGGARLARTIRKKVANEDDHYYRTWNQRSKELDEEIRVTWEAVRSL
ncbi:hypothetical protein F5B22DRAFT_651637 [Xylaria bambusicola]|uniref:uncharacterized protein n=1 Tax=Xylaria bambusicola TaxID=326684 RepID=UPI002007C641|nr:uncharacterized protein F5B22DRAFT_651637 [Xylaria bambusicola]KAI0505572.1 hypothetical protein F5B22DRAFT_651637 [Xylaria bambusicola]